MPRRRLRNPITLAVICAIAVLLSVADGFAQTQQTESGYSVPVFRPGPEFSCRGTLCWTKGHLVVFAAQSAAPYGAALTVDAFKSERTSDDYLVDFGRLFRVESVPPSPISIVTVNSQLHGQSTPRSILSVEIEPGTKKRYNYYVVFRKARINNNPVYLRARIIGCKKQLLPGIGICRPNTNEKPAFSSAVKVTP